MRLFTLLIAAAFALACSGSEGPMGATDDEPADFLSYDEIVAELNDAAAATPSIARAFDLTSEYGTPPTHGGRRLRAIKISDNVSADEDEPAFLLVAAHHGNEIGTPVVALDAVERLIGGYGTDPDITALVDGYEIWIAPVWNPDGYPTSRKNGRPGGGVDVNRNYPFLWDSPCSGSTSPSSSIYKGPEAGSEPETRTMMAFSEDRRFTKVLDFHSSGREVLFAYRCSPHRLTDYLAGEAQTLSQSSSYGGATRPPSAEGEHYQWQLGTYANFAFLTEIDDTQTPTFADAVLEAQRVWPGTVWMLERPIPVRGHVTDATDGAPLEADVSYVENPFTQGERNRSEPRFGRFHAFLPNGAHTLRFELEGYVTREIEVMVGAPGVDLEVELTPEG